MKRRTSLVGLSIGLAAAGVGAAVGLAAERFAVGRPVVRHFPTEDDDVPLGSLREVPVSVVADDGTLLHAEIDEPDDEPPGGVDLDGRTDGADPLTVVFCHGYALNLDSWHFQRLSLQGRVRCVFWDHRGHGRSERGDSRTANIPQLGSDLAHVIRQCAPTGPLVLIGHSMGGMTVMALAARYPEIMDRVVGVGLVATSSGGLSDVDLGLDRFGYLLRRLAPRALSLLAHQPGLVERTRRIGSDLEEVIVKRWSYESDVDEVLIDFTARMIAATRLEVVGDFLPNFNNHDEGAALALLAGKETLVLTGDGDLMIPPEHSAALAEALPGCEYAVVKQAGHLVMLEHPDVVTPHIVSLIHRAGKAAGELEELQARPVTPRRRQPAPLRQNRQTRQRKTRR